MLVRSATIIRKQTSEAAKAFSYVYKCFLTESNDEGLVTTCAWFQAYLSPNEVSVVTSDPFWSPMKVIVNHTHCCEWNIHNSTVI
jgi:hypothetical protein